MQTPTMPPGLDETVYETEAESLPTVPAITVRNRNRSDPTFLELDETTRDPGRNYRWVRLDKNNNSVVKHKMLGYRMEDATQIHGVKTQASPDTRGDSSIAIGDVVLMSCPREDFEKRQEASFRKREAILASTTARTEQMAKEKGIKLIQDDDHNLETR